MSEEMMQALTVLHETIKPVEKAGEVKVPELGGLSSVELGFMRLIDLLGFSNKSFVRPLSLEEAIQLSAVQACLNIIAQDIATAPLRLYRRIPGGKEKVEPGEHWLADLLYSQPNQWHTWYEFLSMALLHFGAVQNVFICKKVSRTGQVEKLVIALPARVQILVNPDTAQYAYDIERVTPHEKVQLREWEDRLPEDEVIHVRGQMFDGLWGYSNLTAGAKSMNLMKELVDYQTRLYRNDASQRGVFQMKPSEDRQTLSDDAFKRLRDQLTDAMTSFREKAKPLLLEEGIEFKAISMDADAAETAKARDQAIQDVARTLRIPPHKLFHVADIKYENMDTFERQYVHDSLIPICVNFEQKLGQGMLNARDRATFFLEFDREQMLLNDIKTMGEFAQKMVSLGVFTLDEVRQKFFMNKLPNGAGNVRLIGSTFAVVDENNEVIIPAGGQTDANPAMNGEQGK